MPVRKFRSVEEMSRVVWYEPGSPEHLRALRAVFAHARQTTRPSQKPGVYKFRSLEEKNDFERRLMMAARTD